MPDPTTHFAIDVPTDQGDTGAWGAILLAAWDDIDAIVRGMAGKPSEQPVIPAHLGNGASSGGFTVAQSGSPARLVLGTSFPNGSGAVWAVPLLHLRVGQQITAFTSRGVVANAATCAVKLCYMDASGARVEVSAGHSLPASEANTTTSGLTHNVAADRAYFVEFTSEVTGTGDAVTLVHVQVATSLL